MKAKTGGGMKKIVLVLVFLTMIFFVIGITAQEPAKDLIDGQEWRKLSAESKAGYLMGFEEGLMIAQTAVMIERKEMEEGTTDAALLDRIEKWIVAYKVGSVLLARKVETADNIFEKEDNRAIMVAAVLPLVSKKVRGEISDEELAEKLEQLRDVLKKE